jgi:glutamate/tyrosine decarboxylase-like PLP-dependent enzyme
VSGAGSARDDGCGLALPAAARHRLLELAAERIARHEDDVDAGAYPASYVHDSIDVASHEHGKRLSASLREDEAPREGADLERLLAEIFDHAAAGGTIHPHPGFMAHVPSGGLLQGAVGEFIAAALNRFAGVWVAAPGLVQLECNVVRWFCGILGYGGGSFGYLTTSGSLANMMGLMCACRRDGGAPLGDITMYTSAQGHYSVLKAARLIGISPSRMRVIAVRPDYAMDVDALARAIEADRALGLRPACVVATAGTTNTGAIDDLADIARACARAGAWMHTDACFGGFFRLTARGRAALAGIEQSDSIAVDAHKSLFLPHGNSALLVRDRAQLAATFETPDADYLPGRAEDEALIDFRDHGPELTRGIRGLAAWLPIKLHGLAAFERCLDRALDLALHLASGLEAMPEIEVVRRHPVRLPVVAFRRRAPAGDEENRRLCRRVCESGRVYLTTTVLPDHGLVLRACILNHRTDRATVDGLLAEVRAALESP